MLVLEEERFNREKHTLRFPFLSLAAAFNGQGLDIDAPSDLAHNRYRDHHGNNPQGNAKR
jgi:hypothetical protein